MDVTHKNTVAKRPKFRVLMFVALLLAALFVIVESISLSVPDIKAGFQHWAAYLNLNWAHQTRLIQVLVDFVLMLWLSLSALFFGGWIVRRSIRKLRGKSWSLELGDNKRKKFFPPVLLYLKFSCFFLVLIFLFVTFQYPLQYILYP